MATAVPCLAAGGPARAAGRLLVPVGDSAKLERVEIALAPGPQRTSGWLRATVSGGAGKFAWVVAVAPGARLDPASEAWLDALDGATAPRVVPPVGAPACGATTATSVESLVDGAQPPVTAPTSVSVLANPTEVASEAALRGFQFSSDDAQRVQEAYTSGARFVFLTHDKTAPSVRTETLRFTWPTGKASFPVGLLAGDTPVAVRLYGLTSGRTRVAAEELESDQLGITWNLLNGGSDYLERRRDVLLGKNGDAWLVEASSTVALTQWAVVKSASIPPAVFSYFERAAQQGKTSAGATECVQAIWDAKAEGALGAKVGSYCAAGLLAQVPGGVAMDCAPFAGPGEIAAKNLICGSADDVALAYAGASPASLAVTRHEGLVTSSAPAGVSWSVISGPAVSAVVVAPEANAVGCVVGNGPGAGGGGGGGGVSGFGGGTGSGGAPVGTAPAPEPYQDDHVDAGFYCSGNTEGSADSCSGDSSDSYDDGSNSSCGGDSSDSYDDGSSDSCSGDSESSSDSGSCSGDSSDAGGGDSCSGDSSGSDASCDGGGSSGGDADCSFSSRRRRPRVSAWALGLIAVILPLRRCFRRRARRRP